MLVWGYTYPHCYCSFCFSVLDSLSSNCQQQLNSSGYNLVQSYLKEIDVVFSLANPSSFTPAAKRRGIRKPKDWTW